MAANSKIETMPMIKRSLRDREAAMIGREVTVRGAGAIITGVTEQGYVVRFADGTTREITDGADFDRIGPKTSSGDAGADARTALADLDAIRRGDDADVGAMAAAHIIAQRVSGKLLIAEALAGGQKAIAERERQLATEKPDAETYHAHLARRNGQLGA